ncbi:class II aaRS and biotin synthetase [Violaceomyces palustris]|uniref:Class II aaRS and biotin synthetase n=1 Tax=Violaceomyces palustris TaxID=1673888 RepID=A0ACD0NSM1_9BASI|nr:class II aaRS and biotin synthetase [Violaceomyces palustris]
MGTLTIGSIVIFFLTPREPTLSLPLSHLASCIPTPAILPNEQDSAIKLSTRWVPTQRDDSSTSSGGQNDQEQPLESLKLLTRGGYLRQSSSGVYTLLPNGLKMVRKIESIIDEEMSRIGADRIDMPTLLPSTLWRKTGRFQVMGNELYSLKDRKASEFILAPTHEEEVTKLVSQEVDSWRSLPVRVYQITRKHRDEPRPRMGLLRTKEFVMKDLYTFDANLEDATKTYEDVTGAYRRIMDRIFGKGSWRVAEADSGAIGGSRSHEYHLEDAAGEDTLLSCGKCNYSANTERAASLPSSSKMPFDSSEVDVKLYGPRDPALQGMTLHCVIWPKQRELNHLKVIRNLPSDPEYRELISDREMRTKGLSGWDWKDRPEGPLVRFDKIKVLTDFECSSLDNEEMERAVTEAILEYASQGVNGEGMTSPSGSSSSQPSPSLSDLFPSQLPHHLENVALPLHLVDVREAEEGDVCPRCRHGELKKSKSIEVGHTFLLGTKYSEALGVGFAPSSQLPAKGKGKAREDQDGEGVAIQSRSKVGKGRLPFQMGCYGIGVTRILGTLAQRAAKEFEDSKGRAQPNKSGGSKVSGGFIWPRHLAPFRAVIIPCSPDTEEKKEACVRIEKALRRGRVVARSDPIVEEDGGEGAMQDDQEEGIRSEDIALDDRVEKSLGSRLTDADLIGYPIRLILGKNWDQTRKIEVHVRVRESDGRVGWKKELVDLEELT